MAESPPTAFLMHPSAVLHDTGWGHPEHQGRLRAIASALKEDLVALHGRVIQVEPEAGREEDVALVHDGALIETVREAVDQAREWGQPAAIDADTRVSGASWEAALGTVGAGLEAVHGVVAGRLPQRLRGRASSRASRDAGPRNGVLPLQQHRRRGRESPRPGRGRARPDRGLGRAPRERHAGLLLRGPGRVLPVAPPVPALSRARGPRTRRGGGGGRGSP